MNTEIANLLFLALSQLLTIGIKLLIAIICVWLAKVGIPWLKQQKIYSLIKIFVNAAEKKADAGSISKSYKKTFVTNLLAALGIEVTEEIDAMIESAVEELDLFAVTAIAQLVDSVTVTHTGDTDDGT